MHIFLIFTSAILNRGGFVGHDFESGLSTTSKLISFEKFEDTKGVIRSCNWQKDKQYYDQKEKDKGTTSDQQNFTLKTKDRATRTPLITGF
jgi:hypothetical protein